MVNQNPAPMILREDIIVQAGDTSGKIQINHSLDISEEFDIYAVEAKIVGGNYDLGNIDNNVDGDHSFTHTDIDDPYLDNRPDEYVEYPICCDPRTWQDLGLSIFDSENPIRTLHGDVIDLSIVNNRKSKQLIFPTPIVVTFNNDLFIEIFNNNPMDASRYTYSYVKIGLKGDIINEEDLIKFDELLANERKGVYNNEEEFD